MRRGTFMLAAMALAMVLASGIALAVTKNCNPGAESCVGTAEPDLLIGSAQGDEIYGLGANDTLRGNGGNDDFFGGPGVDTIEGGTGRDRVFYATQDNDTIHGNEGPDVLRDHLGFNLIYGEAGDDDVRGDNRLYGGDGDDTLVALHLDEAVTQIRMTGGNGNDTFNSTGTGPDIVFAEDNRRDRVNCGPGTDTVFFDAGLDIINRTECENLRPQ